MFDVSVTGKTHGIQNGPSKICGRQPLQNFTWSVLENSVLNGTKNYKKRKANKKLLSLHLQKKN